MLLQPAIIALLIGSALICLVAVVAAVAGLTVLAGWDPERSDHRQLARERRALLVEASSKVVLGCQLVSLFLFLALAEHLHTLFTGAMCAAGSLNASPLGYPTLLVKLAVFLACGLWLIAHRSALRVAGLGMARLKYLSLLGLAALLTAENVLQARYFTDLDPEIITSCCATVFAASEPGLVRDLTALPFAESRLLLPMALALTVGAGARSLKARGSTAMFSLLALALGAISIHALISWVAPAFYQLPTHHCPFCLLSADYGYVGFGLYLSLAIGVVAGCGSGLVRALRRLDPAGQITCSSERRLCATSLAGFITFFLIAMWPLVGTYLRLAVF